MRSFNDRKFIRAVKEHTSIEDCEFTDCVFENCKFDGCTFLNCKFSECTFINCTLVNIKSENTSMLFSVFVECNIIGMQWNTLGSAFAFPVQKFEKCCLKYNGFEGMNFKKFDFLQSEISHSLFQNCNLSESSFKNCNLKNTEFNGCDLRKCDFRQASGYRLSVSENFVKGAVFSAGEALNLLKELGIRIEK